MKRRHRLNAEEIDSRIAGLKSMSDVNEFFRDLIGPVVEKMLEAEMEQHLGYPPYHPSGHNSGNSRNGYSSKTLKGSMGEVGIEVPRDRNGEFEPKAVRKYETVDNEIEEKIISMYAKGMSTRDIDAHMKDIYGASISATAISAITDKVIPLLEEWQARPLEKTYCVLYLDGIWFTVKDNGKITKKCAYSVFGINREGRRDILGIWISETEGAKFWVEVLNDLKLRGVDDVLIACMDGLSGFAEALKSVFPKADVQRCIVHAVRATLKYIPFKYQKEFARDLRAIYTAPTEMAGYKALEEMKKKWPRYILHLERWEKNWKELSAFFKYGKELRRLIYTTNPVENMHRQIRKITKTTTIFPHDQALKKLMFLAIMDMQKKWDKSVRDWGLVISQLVIAFPDRIRLQ